MGRLSVLPIGRIRESTGYYDPAANEQFPADVSRASPPSSSGAFPARHVSDALWGRQSGFIVLVACST